MWKMFKIIIKLPSTNWSLLRSSGAWDFLLKLDFLPFAELIFSTSLENNCVNIVDTNMESKFTAFDIPFSSSMPLFVRITCEFSTKYDRSPCKPNTYALASKIFRIELIYELIFIILHSNIQKNHMVRWIAYRVLYLMVYWNHEKWRWNLNFHPNYSMPFLLHRSHLHSNPETKYVRMYSSYKSNNECDCALLIKNHVLDQLNQNHGLMMLANVWYCSSNCVQIQCSNHSDRNYDLESEMYRWSSKSIHQSKHTRIGNLYDGMLR